MADPKGFMKYDRQDAGYRPVEERVKDYGEVEQTMPTVDRIKQASRCMDCGIPFCNWACDLGNSIPEFNDAIYGNDWQEAYQVLEQTNNFPEFTGRVCPAPCEHACTLNIDKKPVTIRENECAIAERAFFEGFIKPRPPNNRTGKKVAVIGSGPAGLVAADDLNKLGHTVTLYEKDDAVGGLLRYGIPDFKLNKYVIDRRLKIIEQEGLIIKTNTEVGRNVKVKDLLKQYDAIILCIGAMQPRDLRVEGRGLKGVHVAMEFLTQQNKVVRGDFFPESERITAENKNVIVIGGGDTGSDCVGTANRQGAKSIRQVEIMPKPPSDRAADNPWPYYGWILKTTSSHEEGCERFWSMATKRLIGDADTVKKIEVVEVEWSVDETGKKVMKEVPDSLRVWDADLVLLAMGFVHPMHEGLVKDLGLELDAKGNIRLDESKRTSVPKVWAAGDAVNGASLVLRAEKHGKDVAHAVNEFLSEK
jgi:glutamate synthase (NADPH/NADH) small chain